MMACVLKHWDPMLGVDCQPLLIPPAPPVPNTPHVVGAVLKWGPWGILGKGKSEASVKTFHGEVMLRVKDIGYLIPHICSPHVLLPIHIAFSGSKSEFGVASVRCAGGPVAVAGLVTVNLNLNCWGPLLYIQWSYSPYYRH